MFVPGADVMQQVIFLPAQKNLPINIPQSNTEWVKKSIQEEAAAVGIYRESMQQCRFQEDDCSRLCPVLTRLGLTFVLSHPCDLASSEAQAEANAQFSHSIHVETNCVEKRKLPKFRGIGFIPNHFISFRAVFLCV